MRLGVCTSCLSEVSLPEVLRWAGSSGFDAVEIDCPPVSGGTSWYSGSALDVERLDGPGRDAFQAALEAGGLAASALAWYANLVAPGEEGAAAVAHLRRVVDEAAVLGVGVVSIHVGRDPLRGLGEAIAEFSRRIEPVLEQAESSGVRLAVENSPRVGWQFEDMPGNAAFSPELWEKLFTHVRSPALGLALDPSHLVWQGIDPIAALTDYAEKVFHVQASDVELLEMRRQDCGVLRPSGGWWRRRLPGFGVIDWRRLLDRLTELGYEGAVVVEHEDPVWQGSLDQVKVGLGLARRHLVQFLP